MSTSAAYLIRIARKNFWSLLHLFMVAISSAALMFERTMLLIEKLELHFKSVFKIIETITMHNNKYKRVSLFFTIANIYTCIYSNICLYSCHRILFFKCHFNSGSKWSWHAYFGERYEKFFSYSSLLLGIQSFHSFRLAVIQI